MTAIGIAIALGFAGALASLVPAVAGGAAPSVAVPWLPALGVALAFRVDGLSLLFALLISGIGALVLLYAHRYLRGHPHAARLQLFLTLFMLSMLGLVLADDAVVLFVFWELTTVTSYLLIGFDSESAKSRRAALQAMLVTGSGGLALLVGLLILGGVTGTLRISEWIAAGSVAGQVAYTAVFALVVLAAFTKSAQFPFHFWLPGAMAAPTPVSAYLHSATMVKAGVYLLMRMHPVLGGTELWFWTLTVAGSATALWASIVALRQTDLKLALAYSTVTALGFLVLFVGAEIGIAITAAVTFLIVHAFYKSALFLVVGIVDHATGTREAQRLGGLARTMPTTAAAAGLAALSMAGFPPLLGFIGKELKYEAALAIVSQPLVLATLLVVANALTFAVAAVVAFRPFWRGEPETPRMPHEAPRRMRAGPLLLAAAGFAFGVYPELVGRYLVEPAVAAIRATPMEVDLKLWHGVNVPLAMSVATALLGLAIYAAHERVRAVLARAVSALPLTGERAFDASLDALRSFAAFQTRILQGGSLRRYLFATWLVLPAAVGSVLVLRGGLAWPASPSPVPVYAWPIVLLVAAGSIAPIVTTSRLASIAALGLVGAGVSLLYLLFGAPDVAMTQLLVETLTVVIVAVVLLRLPRFSGRDHPGSAGRARDAALAIAAGTTVSALLLAVLASPLDPSLSDWFAANALPAGFGRNVVNVVIVDFRALDTLGEITVVTVAACAAYALLKLRPGASSEQEGA
ncbi:MAG: Na(+)/H(+) antiporter subunit A [Proteobacteria bacterium]|nr:MAG: Na(+)/H(+) antiporter subunit A [Pseudomonadota bacterium]